MPTLAGRRLPMLVAAPGNSVCSTHSVLCFFYPLFAYAHAQQDFLCLCWLCSQSDHGTAEGHQQALTLRVSTLFNSVAHSQLSFSVYSCLTRSIVIAGSTSNVFTPPSTDTLTDVSSLAAGYSHTCVVLAASGGVHCWGFNLYGQIGNGCVSSVTCSQGLSTAAYLSFQPIAKAYACAQWPGLPQACGCG